MKPILALAISAVFVNTALAGSILSTEQARDHIGQKDVGVAGFVTQVTERSGNLYVNFQGDRPNKKFVGVIPQEHVESAGGHLFLQALPGQFVAIGGQIQKYGNGAQIVVRDKKQFLVAQ